MNRHLYHDQRLPDHERAISFKTPASVADSGLMLVNSEVVADQRITVFLRKAFYSALFS